MSSAIITPQTNIPAAPNSLFKSHTVSQKELEGKKIPRANPEPKTEHRHGGDVPTRTAIRPIRTKTK